MLVLVDCRTFQLLHPYHAVSPIKLEREILYLNENRQLRFLWFESIQEYESPYFDELLGMLRRYFPIEMALRYPSIGWAYYTGEVQ